MPSPSIRTAANAPLLYNQFIIILPVLKWPYHLTLDIFEFIIQNVFLFLTFLELSQKISIFKIQPGVGLRQILNLLSQILFSKFDVAQMDSTFINSKYVWLCVWKALNTACLWLASLFESAILFDLNKAPWRRLWCCQTKSFFRLSRINRGMDQGYLR